MNPRRYKMPALGEILDMGSGYAICHGGVLCHGLHIICRGDAVIGTARSFDEAGRKIEDHIKGRIRDLKNEEPRYADR